MHCNLLFSLFQGWICALSLFCSSQVSNFKTHLSAKAWVTNSQCVSPLHKAMQDKDRNAADKALDWNQWLFFLLLTGTAAPREKCCGDKLSSCADLLHHLLLLDHPMAATEHCLTAAANHLWNKRFCKNEQDPSCLCFVSQILKLLWLFSWLLVLT